MTETTIEWDQYGRYLIVPGDGAKAVAHTRATTLAATLDDRYALEKWGQRMAAIGLARRPDLLAQVAAHADDKKRVDSIVVDATEAAEASRGRNMGDAIHTLTERHDRGDLSLADIGDAWRDDIAAYVNAITEQQFEIELIEQTVIVPQLTVAGTLDRTVLRDGQRYILDVKTGQGLGMQPIAIQLALYSRAETLYDHQTKTHTPMPPVNQDVGFVFHVAAGSGVCEVIAVDLQAGWQGALLAQTVRAWRRHAVVVELPPRTISRRPYLIASVRRLVEQYPDAAAALAAQWPADVPTLRTNGHTPEQLDQIAAVLQRVEGEFQIPFGEEPDPGSLNREETNRKELSA